MLSFGFSSTGVSSASAEQASSSTPPRSRSETRHECEAPYGECPATRVAANATITQIGRAIADAVYFRRAQRTDAEPKIVPVNDQQQPPAQLPIDRPPCSS